MRFFLFVLLSFPFIVSGQKKKIGIVSTPVQSSEKSDFNKYSNSRIPTMETLVMNSVINKVPTSGKVLKDMLLVQKKNGEIESFDLKNLSSNWLFKFNDSSSERKENQFRVDGATLYSNSCQNHLVALDINTGNVYWKDKIGIIRTDRSYMMYGQHLPIKDNKIYLESCNNRIYAINKFDGSMIWNYRLDFEYCIYSPVVFDNYVFVNNAPWVYCFKANSGQDIWQRGFDNVPMYTLLQADSLKVYAGTEKDQFYALNIKNNASIDWEFKTDAEDWGVGNNTIYANNILYLGAKARREDSASIYSIQTENGKKIWKTKLSNGGRVKEISLINGYLLGSTTAASNNLFVLNANTGKKKEISYPKEIPVSNIVEYSKNNAAFITKNYFVIYNYETNTYQYINLALKDIKDVDYINCYIAIVKSSDSIISGSLKK